MLHFNKMFKLCLRNRCCLRVLPADVVVWDGLRKGLSAWGTLLRDGPQERHAEGGNRKSQGSPQRE